MAPRFSADAVRLCGTLRAAAAESDRVILMSSAYPREGVSTITAQLGQALAMMSHEPVLLLDTNLRHPSLHELLHVSQEPDLTDYLRGAADFDGVLHSTSIVRLCVLPAGKAAASGTAEIVQSERYAELLELARKRFRYVIPTPPRCCGMPTVSSSLITWTRRSLSFLSASGGNLMPQR